MVKGKNNIPYKISFDYFLCCFHANSSEPPQCFLKFWVVSIVDSSKSLQNTHSGAFNAE